MEATIYYLNWDREQDNHAPASTLFHKLNVESVLEEDEKPSDCFSETEFNDLYREVIPIDADPDQLEDVWREWQRTGYTESREFIELRYCTNCQTYIEGIDEAVTHASQNHGYNALDNPSEPDYVRGERSMSVGDVVEFDGTYFQAKSLGWEEITVQGETE